MQITRAWLAELSAAPDTGTVVAFHQRAPSFKIVSI
jgi:hypothetical protein